MSQENRISNETHRWNFHLFGWEVALHSAGVRMIGPMVLIPFLFYEVGIHVSWLGLFPIARNMMSLTGPIGAAWGGGLEQKKRYCIRWGIVHSLPFVLVPVGIIFFFERPSVLLCILVLAWILAHLGQGLFESVKQTVMVNSIQEAWWGRMMGYRQVMTAVVGIAASGLLWLLNKHVAPPTSYVYLSWAGVFLMAVSLIIFSQIREVPAEKKHVRPRKSWRTSWGMVGHLWSRERPVRWLVYGRWARCTGMFINTYVTVVFMEQCGLTSSDMWLPVLLITIAEILSFALASWFVDRIGAKTAMVLSGFLMAANAILMMVNTSIWGFVLLFPFLTLAQGLMRSGWPTLVMKMAPVEERADYHAAVNLSVLPGMYLAFASGIVLVRYTGFDVIFYVTLIGSLLGSLCFYIGLPNTRVLTVEDGLK
ncbi:MAG: MFS transporter [Candidatus Hydrogenedentota bacterium]